MMNTVIPEFAPENIRDPASIGGPGSWRFVLTHYGRDDTAP
jgi:hypothetical protein